MKATMEDFRLQAVGGIAGAIDVWEMGICSKLLANCGSWVEIGKPALKQLNQLQESYLRMVYSCPPSTPIPALRALAGIWNMEHKVALEKVCLVTITLHRKHMYYTRESDNYATVSDNYARVSDNYASEFLEDELRQGWPGITEEVQDICRDMGLPDATLKYLSRKEIKEAMCYHHLGILKRDAR